MLEHRDRAAKRAREEQRSADQERGPSGGDSPGHDSPHNRTGDSRDIWKRIGARAQRTAQEAQRAVTDQLQAERLQEHGRGAPHNRTASSRQSGADHPDPLAEVVRGAELTLGYNVEEADEEIEMLDEGPGEGAARSAGPGTS